MLSLKHTRLRPPPRFGKSITDLPNEILSLIFELVYQSSGGVRSSVFAVSRSCRKLRVAAYPLLFAVLVVRANDNIIERHCWQVLEELSVRPQFLKYVRCLEIQSAIEVTHLPIEKDLESARRGRFVSKNRLLKCVSMMTGLRVFRIFFVSDLNFDVLAQLPNRKGLHVSLEMSTSELCFDNKQSQRLQDILAAGTNWTCGLSLPPSRYTRHRSTELADLITASRVNALDWCDNWLTLDTMAKAKYSLPNLQELHVSSKVLQAKDRLLASDIIPWRNLKRLHVDGDRQIKHLLSSIIDKLNSIEELCLHASTTEAFHDDCLNPNRTLPPPVLPFAKLTSLRRLSLRGVCPHLHVSCITAPTLRSLSLVLPEYLARLCGFTEARQPSEIRWIARNLPHLEHLEINIGALENLWNPTAIPGVEVPVEVYSALTVITQIRKLRTLRLFPPYVPRNAGHNYLNARQPLSDEQAIRVFHHLHTQRPSIQTLSIAATFYALRGFSPMSWLVRDGGNNKTILTTRQAEKDYDLKQTWVGQRRLSMTNHRHLYRKSYLPDLWHGWVFPIEDPLV